MDTGSGTTVRAYILVLPFTSRETWLCFLRTGLITCEYPVVHIRLCLSGWRVHKASPPEALESKGRSYSSPNSRPTAPWPVAAVGWVAQQVVSRAGPCGFKSCFCSLMAVRAQAVFLSDNGTVLVPMAWNGTWHTICVTNSFFL